MGAAARKPMTRINALNRARKLYGRAARVEVGKAGKSLGAYRVGYLIGIGFVMFSIKGHGDSWEAAFAMIEADSAKVTP